MSWQAFASSWEFILGLGLLTFVGTLAALRGGGR